MILSAIACISGIVLQPVINDDRDVIQTAMLSFFTPEKWYSADWKPEKHVVIRTQLRNKQRPSFDELFDRIKKSTEAELDYIRKEIAKPKSDTGWSKEEMESYDTNISKELENLKSAGAFVSEGGEYVPPPITPLKSMTWDSRIIVTDEYNRGYLSSMNKNSKLEARTVYAGLERPCYSKNGRYAIVQMSVPWSIHSADISFVFERKGLGWERIAVSAMFYV